MFVSMSGKKDEALARLKAQYAAPEYADKVAAVEAVVNALPGDSISMSGAIECDGEGKSGRVSLTGSSWTSTPAPAEATA